MSLKKSVALVGLMGCGKSSVGVKLAKRLGVKFADSDKVIEETEKSRISSIFNKHGENYFRQAEHNVVQRLSADLPMVIATGGGAFINESTQQVLQNNCITVWIEANIEVLFERVNRKKTRPLLENGGDKKLILQNLIAERYPIYKKAQLTVNSGDYPHYVVVEAIVDKLKKNGLYHE